jgi:hypothetical protein
MLPRELRDQIYMEVLFHPNGLVYKPGKGGVSSLCSRPSKSLSPKAWLRRALSAKILARSKKHRPDANQLKYVCRQLYNETKGLVVRRNVVHLQDTSTWSATEQCIYIVRHWPIFRRIAIKPSFKRFVDDVGKKNLLAVVQHCIEHADVSVGVHIPHWSQADPNFVLRGLSYLATLRKEDRIMTNLALITPIPFFSDSETNCVARNLEVPCNFRWFPEDDKFDRQLFERNVCNHPALRMPLAQAVVLDLAEIVANWFVRGL